MEAARAVRISQPESVVRAEMTVWASHAAQWREWEPGVMETRAILPQFRHGMGKAFAASAMNARPLSGQLF